MNLTFPNILCNIAVLKGFIQSLASERDIFFSFFSPSAQEAQEFDHVHTFPLGMLQETGG